MILITTPTGDIGSRVLAKLVDSDAEIRVIARNPSAISSVLRDRIEILEGSHSDRSVIEEALAGAKGVFWLPPGSPVAPSADAAYVRFSEAFCAELPKSSARHVVSVSAWGRGWNKPAGQVTASLQMDDMIAETGVHHRALACASLIDNIMRQAELIATQGVFYQPTPGDYKLPNVAKSDIATVAADLLLDLNWQGTAEIPLLGPEDISFNEMAATMTDVLGRSVRFQEISMSQFEEMLLSMGASAGMAKSYVDMFTAKNQGMDTVSPSITRANTPTSFRNWCEAELAPALAASA